MNTADASPQKPCSWVPDQVRDDGMGATPYLRWTPPAARPNSRRQRRPARMSWLNRVRNSIPFLPKRETPDNLWHKCRQCNAMVFTKEWEENDFVCPRCDHHGRMGARPRFELLL